MNHTSTRTSFAAHALHSSLACALLLSAASCKPEKDEPKPRPSAKKSQAAQADSPDEKSNSEKAGGDPMKGKFTLDQATKGLSGDGELVATIETEQGTLKCDLFDDKAPVTVANFVGLARGLRPFEEKGKWVKKPAYDGTTFHRVIEGFMIQGGDPTGTGQGEPGYTIDDEIWEGAKHDERGLLCMANRGKNTNGMQFFITDGPAAHLDGGYTIFGKCTPDSLIEKLASVPTRGGRAVDPPVIEKVTIQRES